METDLVFSLLFIFALILCSAFFSCSETGLTAASKAKLHSLAKEGNKRAKMAEQLRLQKEGLIGTILLGNNAVNILASALATSLAIRYWGQEGVAIVTVIMTLVILIFAEVLPKTYALYQSEKISLIVSPILTLLVKLFGPITLFVQMTVNALMRVLGLDHKEQGLVSDKDALRGAIALHHHEGSVLKSYRHMLDSVLDLAEIEVHEVMTHRRNIFSVSINLPTKELVEKVLSSNHTRIPIWQDRPDNIIGVLHVRDLVSLCSKEPENIKKSRLKKLIKEAWFIPETTPIGKQLSQFRNRRNHLALVVDEYGDLIGLITLEDILEEIVGDIEDEHDVSSASLRKLKDSAYRVAGDLPVRDINRKLDWNLPDDDAPTIAGLVIHDLERIPSVGDIFMLYGYEFKILKKRNNQITSIKIRKLKSQKAS
jgi:Mg2+/Co2+ transporter CorB